MRLFWQTSGRLLLVWLALMGGGIGLGYRVYQLQIVEADALAQRARSQQEIALAPYIPRRSILDRQGNALATDRIVYTLYVHPQLFSQNLETVAEKLATILPHRTPGELSDRFRQQGTGIRLENDLSEETASKLQQLSLDGIELDRHYTRFYPQNELAANVVGYVRKDEHLGQAGVEFTQQKLLQRQNVTLNISRSGNGELLPESLPEGSLHLDDLSLQLTIDIRLQRSARAALLEKMEEFNAKRGTVIVMDARDGSILSLVCEPTYDPNRYYDYDLAHLKTWAVTDLYEPGSTFKPINVAIAIDAGVLNPNAIIYDSGSVSVGGWTIRNHDFYRNGGHGAIDPARILQVSSNVGMIKIMERLTPRQFYDKLLNLGMEEKVGIELLGEIPGRLKSEFQFLNYPIEPATTSFGQGFAFTPVKLAQLHGALASGGKLVTPHVVRGLVDASGNLQQAAEHPVKQVFSPQTARTVLEMMETVVTEGSGKSAQIPGYRIGGKTGTAQKASRGYYGAGKITSFVGIVPIDAPRYVVIAVVDEPRRGVAFGSTVTAPIVKSVMETLVAIEGLPPSLPIETEENEQ